MPFIWTHILFSEEVIDASNHPYSNYDQFMKLGAQGPCLFMHYNLWWKKKDPLYFISKDLYTNHYTEFITDLILGAKDKEKQVQAFVMGQVTHFILHRNVFPYIHYYANKEENSFERMEIMIDAMLMDKCYNIKTWKNKIYKEIDVGNKLHEEITNLLTQIFKKYYPEFSLAPPNYLEKAYRDLKLSLKLLSDPYGWKSILLKPFRSLTVYGPIRTKKDYLNLKKNSWYNAETKQSSNQSFLDLYQKSRTEGVELTTLIQKFWKGKTNLSRQTLHAILMNHSYAHAMD